MRVCADCRFHSEADGKHKCTAIIDLVTGNQQDIECLEARQSSWLCGIDGKLFKEGDGVQDKRIAKERAGRSEGKRQDLKPGRSDG